MKKKIIRIIGLVCFCQLFLFISAKALAEDPKELLEESLKQNSKVVIIADINIRNAEIKKVEKNNLKILFNVENLMATRSGLIYGVEVVKENPDKSIVLMDEEVFREDPLAIRKNESIHKEINYFAPEYLSGKFLLWLKIKDESGLVFAQQSFPVEFAGNGILLEQSNPCYLTIEGEEKKYNLAEGISLKKDERIFLNCYTQNNLGEGVSLKPYFEFYRRTFYGLKMEEREGENEVYFKKDEDRINQIIIPLPKVSQAYDVKIVFRKEGKIVSNPIIAHLVFSGKSISINSLTLDKDQYFKGEIAHLEVLWFGPADSFRGSRTGGSGLVDPFFEIEIKDQNDSMLCASKQVKKASEVRGNVDILLEKDCFEPAVNVRFLEEGQLLYEKTLIIQPSLNLEEKLKKEINLNQEKNQDKNFFWKNSKGLILVIGLVFLIFLFWFFIKKRSILVLVFLLVYSFLLVGKTRAVTATLYGTPFYLSVAYSNLVGANFVPLSTCGDTYSCYPYCDPNGAHRITDNCLINSYVVRVDGRFIGCYQDIVSFNYSLNTSEVNQGDIIQASGSATGDNMCNNGLTIGMAVSPKNDGVNLYWLINNAYINTQNVSSSGSYSFSTAGYSCGNYNSAFYYAFKHGYVSDVTRDYDRIGSGLIGYTVKNCAVPINGACGPAATTYSSTATTFSGALCSAGTADPASPAFPNPGSSTAWTCLGQNGGNSSPPCTATRCNINQILISEMCYDIINGECGDADGEAFCAKPSDGLCDKGNSTLVTFSNNKWSWNCIGLFGGGKVSCSARKECPWVETTN